MDNIQEKLNKIAKEVQDLLIGEKNKELTSYLDSHGYIYSDMSHLGIYTVASIIVTTTELYCDHPAYHDSLFTCLIHNLILKDIVQIR